MGELLKDTLMHINEKTKNRENKHIEHKSDLVVVGGGLSGVCCAISAARQGMQVALVQDRPVLGGNGSSEIRVWALGATSHMGNNNRWAREGGLIDEIMVENLHRNKEGNPFLLDALLLDKVLKEKNIELYLNTVVNDITKSSEDVIDSVIAYNSQNSTSYCFKGNLFCDASGDGILGYLAGASFRSGAEDAEEFHEGFSPSEEYGELLGHTIFLYPKMTDAPVKFIAPDFALKDMSVIPKLHQIKPNQIGCNYWWFEYGGNMDTIYDSEKIKMELWKIVYGAWNHIKNSGLYPEAENMTLEWVGAIPGKRESRRFSGLYTMTQHDIVNQTQFDDAIAYGGWAIDLHPADGIFSKLSSCNQFHSKGIYSIPYRSYVSQDIKNLYFLGRLISVSHVAFGSTRVMITSAFGGQAIGIAAALCKANKCFPKDILGVEKLKELQQILSLNGQSIPHIPINENDNLVVEADKKVSSVLILDKFEENNEWQSLDFSRAMILPLTAFTKYTFGLKVEASEGTTMKVDLMVSMKPYNYTPDKLIEHLDVCIEPGVQDLVLAFKKMIETDCYAFLILRQNNHIKVALSDERVTGILSASNKFNLAVNNHGRQMAPPNSGFENFEFFTPDRRPQGKNLAISITPAIRCFSEDNLCNGFVRPYLKPNAWVADKSELRSELIFAWKEEKHIKNIKLYFDNDYDHPMETIQWNHPERTMPFCIKKFSIFDHERNLIVKCDDNCKTIYSLDLDVPIKTNELHVVLEKSNRDVPISLFEIEIR